MYGVLPILKGLLLKPFSSINTALHQKPLHHRGFANEWTALGDSYAVGAGTGEDLGWGRCLRFSESYPELMLHQSGSNLLGANNTRRLNFPACSGATTSDITAHQFDTSSSYNLEYGERPGFGNPTFATLTAAGDDIDFVNLVRNCIYDILPWRSCKEQREDSWKLINAPTLVDNIDGVIQETVNKGRGGTAGDQFQLFVTSYAKFFNDETDQCSNVTWSILPAPFGNRQELTREVRQDLNNMTDHLNHAIKKAVDRNVQNNVYFVDWDAEMEGHRYCEVGVQEPCDDCENVWFWQYPFKDNVGNSAGKFARQDEQLFQDHVARIWDDAAGDMEGLISKRPSADTLPSVPEHLHGAHSWIGALQDLTNPNATGSHDEKGLKFPEWLIDRVRVFHPRLEAHELIATGILKGLQTSNAVQRSKQKEL